MFSHRKLVSIPVSAMRGFASLLALIHVRQSKCDCRDLRNDGSGEVRSFEILRQCLSNFVLGFFLTGTTNKISKNISHLFSNTRMLFLQKYGREILFSLNVTDRVLRECESGTVTWIFGPSGKKMEKMHNAELNDYYF
jgi:hypothetical protein